MKFQTLLDLDQKLKTEISFNPSSFTQEELNFLFCGLFTTDREVTPQFRNEATKYFETNFSNFKKNIASIVTEVAPSETTISRAILSGDFSDQEIQNDEDTLAICKIINTQARYI